MKPVQTMLNVTARGGERLAGRAPLARSVRGAAATSSLLVGCCLVGMLTSVGCGGSKQKEGTTAAGLPGQQEKAREKVTVQAFDRWNRAMEIFDAAEASGWSSKVCDDAEDAFEDAHEAQDGNFAEATYMVGLVRDRCGDPKEARSKYKEALEENPRLCEAKVHLAVDTWNDGNVSAAARMFEEAVRNDNQCTDAYLNTAMIQRSNKVVGNKDAENNFRRALAVRSDYLPVFNELGLFYLEQAKASGDKERLDLAEIVCRQAQIINDKYAPIYNTWGLIKMQREDIIVALRMFEKAIALDPSIFEAHMNFGHVTSSFRGYKDARASYAKAVELNPKSYEAQIGLGIALRGLKQVADAEKAYLAAIKLDSKRPEAYFNLGVLYQDYQSGSIADLNKAKEYFGDFMRSGGKSQAFKEQVEELNRECKDGGSRKSRRRMSKCRPGRLQNINLAIQLMKEAGAAGG